MKDLQTKLSVATVALLSLVLVCLLVLIVRGSGPTREQLLTQHLVNLRTMLDTLDKDIEYWGKAKIDLPEVIKSGVQPAQTAAELDAILADHEAERIKVAKMISETRVRLLP